MSNLLQIRAESVRMAESNNLLLISENIELVCRICLGANASEDIFEGDPPEILTKLLACTSIKVTNSDGLPRLICFSCMLRLNDAYSLVCQCEANDRLLHEMLLDRNIFKDEEKEEDFDADANIEVELPQYRVKFEFSERSDEHEVNRRDCKENKKPTSKCEPLLCSYCNKEFKRKDVLGRHVLQHMDVKPFQCHLCHKAFRSRDTFSRHELVHKEQCYVCDICGKTFKDSYYITKHKRNVHNEIKYRCNICNKELKTKNSLKIHMLIHSDIKKYICTHCGQKFTHLQSLKGHLRTHTGGKPYACKYCDSKFSTLKSRIEHERLHTGQRPYQCPICSKGFAQKSNMKSHFIHNHKCEKWELHNPKSLRKQS